MNSLNENSNGIGEEKTVSDTQTVAVTESLSEDISETEEQTETVSECCELVTESTEVGEAPEPETGSPESEPDMSNTVVFVPNVSPEPLPASKNGMRVFFTITAVVLALCVCLAGGYVAGREMRFSTKRAPAGVTAKPSTGDELTEIEIYERVSKSVVGIVVYNKSGEASTASGVVLSADGYIITNDHIYSDTENAKFVVVAYDGSSYDAYYVAGDTRSDLAVLKADTDRLVPAEFGDSSEVVVGERAYAVGCTAGAYDSAVITGGMVSSVTRRVQSSTTSYSAKFIQTDSAINPGSSGGALANAYGQIIGITSSKYAGDVYDSIGFAVPSNSAVRIVKLLIENGYVKGRAKLGISYTENSEVAARLNGLAAGLQIVAINEDSSFANTSVSVGDIIVGVNDNRITRGSEMLDFIEAAEAGDTVLVRIYKKATSTETNVKIILGEDRGSSSYSYTGEIDSETAIN